MSAKLVVGDAEGGGLDCERSPIGATLAPSGLGVKTPLTANTT
jgi:hypothetical protein